LHPIDAPEAVAFGLLELGILAHAESQLEEARRNFDQSLALYRELNNPWDTSNALHWLSNLSVTEGVDGDNEDCWQRANDYSLEALALLQQLGNLRGIAMVKTGLSGILVHFGDYAQALQFASDSYQLFEQCNIQWGLALSLFFVGGIASMLGKTEQARQSMVQGIPIIMQFHLTAYKSNFIYVAADIYLSAGETERAYELLSFFDHIRQGASRVVFPQMKKLDEELPPKLLAAMERGKSLDLDATLQQVLVEFSRDSESTVSSQPLSGPLSERETEILRLVANGLSNREIADQLYLAVGTVKWYMSEIYSKLHVGSRTQAIFRAREMNLIL
jgi:DNA-binding CsgD family transcriptional regulator